MSVYAKLDCENCGNSFEVYQTNINERGKPVHCPHCFQQMDKKHWDGLIDAFYTVHDWNYQNLKAHSEHGTAGFKLQLIYKDVPQEKIKFD